MRLSSEVLTKLITMTDKPDFTSILITKFLNEGDIYRLLKNLNKTDRSLERTTNIHQRERLHRTRSYIEKRLMCEVERSVVLDAELKPYLETSSKEIKDKYEVLLSEFKLSML